MRCFSNHFAVLNIWGRCVLADRMRNLQSATQSWFHEERLTLPKPAFSQASIFISHFLFGPQFLFQIVLKFLAFPRGSPRWKTCTLAPRALFAASRRELSLRTWSLVPSFWYSRDSQPNWFRLDKAYHPIADFDSGCTQGIILLYWSGRRLDGPHSAHST